MNTRSAEIELLLADILKESLQQGITPDFLDLTDTKEFNNIGAVVQEARLVSKTSSSSEVNDWISKLEYYTRVLDRTASLQVDDIKNHKATFPKKVKRLERWYKKLAYKIESMLAMVSSGTDSVYSITESFNSLANIDLDYTTAYIDTEAGLATIGFSDYEFDTEAESGGANVSIQDFRITDKTKEIQVSQQDGGLDYKHTTFTPNGVSARLILRINNNNDLYNGGFLQFDVLFPQTTKILAVQGTSDAINFEDLKFFEKGSRIVVPISKSYKSSSIVIDFAKTSFDGIKITPQGKISYQYLFKFYNMAVPNRRYKSAATVYSTEFTLPSYLKDRAIGVATLTLNDALVTGDSSIDSYISLDTSDWIKIVPGEQKHIGEVNTGQTYHPTYTKVRDLPSPMSLLEGLSPEIVNEFSELLEGWGQAEIESTTYSDDYSDFTLWPTVGGQKEYQDFGVNGLYLAPEMSHKIYLKVKADKAKDIILTSVGVKSQEDPDNNQATYTKLIFNGQEIQGKELPLSQKEYLLSLVKGDNTINILIGVEGSYGGYLNIGSQLARENLTVFVNRRNPTSLEALDSIDATDKCYAVVNGVVFINYVPPFGAKFVQNYTSPTSNLPSKVSVRIDLDGDSVSSPVLGGYRLEFSPGLN